MTDAPEDHPPVEPVDELTQAALSDPGAADLNGSHDAPTLWRVLTVIAVAVAALAIVFWR